MNAEDRELLEMAAKACGGNLLSHSDFGDLYLIDGKELFWDPLNDDGDAFRLSVELQISILSNIIRYEASTIALTLAGVFIREEMLNQRPGIAARRAIVRAAAETFMLRRRINSTSQA